MKKLIILFLVIFSLTAHAQDWHGVVRGDTTYYHAKDHAGLLNVIWIDSAKSMGSDSIYHFFPSFSLTSGTSQCYDSLGATWLGKNFIRKNGGDEIYFDRWEDSILIKTKASLLNIWTMYTDTSGLNYIATVSANSTALVDGMLDSIKEINIQIFNGTTAVTNHPLFNYKIKLSKAHGFINTLPFFELSYSNVSTYNYTRVPHEVNDYFFSPRPLAFYQTGNARLRRVINGLGSQYIPPTEYYYYDTIINAQMISANLLAVHKEEYEFKRVYYQTTIPNYADTVITTLVTKFDTFNINNYSLQATTAQFQSTILPNVSYAHSIANASGYFFKDYYLRELDSCSFKWLLETKELNNAYYTNLTDTCWRLQGNLAANIQRYETKILSGNIEDEFDAYSVPLLAGMNIRRDLLYYKQDSCVYGSPFNIFALSNNTIEDLSKRISIYPNPSNDKIVVDSDLNLKRISLFDIAGQNIRTLITENQINVRKLPNGLYILKIETEKGSAYKKIMVQH